MWSRLSDTQSTSLVRPSPCDIGVTPSPTDTIWVVSGMFLCWDLLIFIRTGGYSVFRRTIRLRSKNCDGDHWYSDQGKYSPLIGQSHLTWLDTLLWLADWPGEMVSDDYDSSYQHIPLWYFLIWCLTYLLNTHLDKNILNFIHDNTWFTEHYELCPWF